MDQGKIISRAWEITWNNRMLWGLGFLAALAGSTSSGGSTSFNTNSFNLDPANPDALPPALQDGPVADLINGNVNMDMVMALVGGLIVLICLAIIVGIVLWFVGLAARAGLITSVVGLQNGQKISFGDAFRGGWSLVGRLFVMKVILVILPMLFFLIVGGVIGALFGITESGAVLVLLCPLIIAFIVIVYALQFTDAYAYRGVVLKDMGAVEAIKHGWSVFRNSVFDSLILGVIYGVISLVFGLVLSIFLGFFAFLSAGPAVEFFETGQISTGGAITGMLAILFLTVVSALLGSVITAWQSAGFTLAYQELTGMAMPPIGEKGPEDIGSVSFDSMINDTPDWEKGPQDIDDGSGQDMI